MEAFLRWAGSKKQLLPKLKPYWRQGRRTTYIEPFAGSSVLFFCLQPTTAVLGDLNEELIGTLRSVQAFPIRVIECLQRYPRGKRAYYDLRSTDPQSLTEVERAARFIYLNHYCFNGLYRTNRNGEFNVPLGRHKGPHSLDVDLIWQAAEQLQRAMLVNGDFEDTLRYAGAGDFVYLDPPYALDARRTFTEYHPLSFSTADLARLAIALEELDDKGATFVLSYANCAEAREIGANWYVRRVWARRNIAGFSGDRKGVTELLISNRQATGGRGGH